VSAIALDRVTKVFRRTGGRAPAGTLKSAFLSRRGRPRAEAGRAFTALSEVSFEVPAGQTVGVIGENGSGKSTLLKLLAGILRPTSGSIETEGRVAALIELGAGFHPELTARENIEINGMLLGLPRREMNRRAGEIIDFAGVAEFADEPVRVFSSGMLVRLGFAIAAHVEPQILLVDEVLSVGDEYFTHRCREKMAEFQNQGRTIVVVSHDLDLVEGLCPRVLRLDAGRLVADGPPAETIGRYRGAVAAAEGRARLAADWNVEGRWGSGAARIDAVRLLGPEGGEARLLEAGRAFRVELSGRTIQPIADFVAGVQISTVDGSVVYGSNTLLDGFRLGGVEGGFRVELAIESADLAAGTYSLDVAVHAADGAPYDYRRDVLRFDVAAPERAAGVWRPKRRWSFSREGEWKA
jgi:ABC-type polysaccharide/polyol phosphate transport system ATPase subunit